MPELVRPDLAKSGLAARFRRWQRDAALVLATAAVSAGATALWFAIHFDLLPAGPCAEAPVAPAMSAQLIVPVRGVAASALTDTFTQSRAGGARAHDAIDIMAPRGTGVVAAGAGRVEKLFLSHDGGITVYVRSPDRRRIYYYAHLDGYAPGLAEGAAVRPGSPLGAVGSTGNASRDAPHLHFAVMQADPAEPWYRGRAINPYPLLTRR